MNLNLLNIIFVTFFGFYGDDTRYYNFDYKASPEISFNELVVDDSYSTEIIIDINYFLSISSSDFEDDTGYDSYLIDTSNEHFIFDDMTLYMYDNLTIYLEFYDFNMIYGVRDNISFIDIFYYTYFEIGLTLIDGTYIDQFREVYNVIHLDTNFTINDRVEIIDDTNFNIKFDYDFVGSYEDGYEVGYEDGYDNGFTNGEEYGYQQGANDLNNVFNGDWVGWLGSAVTGFFALEIFPNFTLGGVIGAIICVWIWLWILKVFAGG